MINLLGFFAASASKVPTFAELGDKCTSGFLGLKPWYYYLQANEADCTVYDFQFLGTKSDFPLIFLVIVDDLLRVAGLIAVFFVIFGAIGFITSEGSPDKAANARTTIINSLLGLAICIIASVFVAFLGSKLTS